MLKWKDPEVEVHRYVEWLLPVLLTVESWLLPWVLSFSSCFSWGIDWCRSSRFTIHLADRMCLTSRVVSYFMSIPIDVNWCMTSTLFCFHCSHRRKSSNDVHSLLFSLCSLTFVVHWLTLSFVLIVLIDVRFPLTYTLFCSHCAHWRSLFIDLHSLCSHCAHWRKLSIDLHSRLLSLCSLT